MSLSQDAGIDFALTVRLYPDAPCRGTRSCTTCIVMCKPIKDLFFNALPGTGKTGCKDKKFTATLPNFQGSFFFRAEPGKRGKPLKHRRLRSRKRVQKYTLAGNGQNKWGTFFEKKFPNKRRKQLQYSGLKKRQGQRKGRGRERKDTLLYNIRGKGAAQEDRETSARERQAQEQETGTPLTQRGRT